MVGPMGGDVGAVLRVNEAVFREDAGGGAELADFAADAEDPAGETEFAVAGVDPVAGVFDMAEEAVADDDVAGRDQHLVQHGIRLAAEHQPRREMKMAIGMKERLVNDRGAEGARGFPGVLGQRRGVEGRAEEFPPLLAIVVVEGELPRPAPDLDALDETGAQGRQAGVQLSLGVGPVEPVDAQEHAAVHARAQVHADPVTARVEPPDDLHASHFRPPGGGTVDVEEGRDGVGHEGS